MLNFAPMNEKQWTENIIIADADYIDKVAFDLTVNFERMIGRRIPKADIARWLECIALDGGLRNGEHESHAVLVHDHQRQQMENFMPSDLAKELNGQAFRGPLGEFTIAAVSDAGMATKESLFLDTLQFLASQKEVKRLMVIPDEAIYNKVREVLRKVDDDEKRITVFAMSPQQGGNFRQEILGFSLMAALGIKSEELKGTTE